MTHSHPPTPTNKIPTFPHITLTLTNPHTFNKTYPLHYFPFPTTSPTPFWPNPDHHSHVHPSP
ncbi:hypothetical protein, partial [Kocuria rhizophila]|uniref:hypothetical protein n=1 Tax=Kocuria rhizophila TaxID=72000 RepID=UPI001C92D646